MAADFNWNPYDPSWLVKLAQERHPEELWLHEALNRCTQCLVEFEQYYYFVDRMEGKFAFNVVLYSEQHGKVVLDILEDGRVGSMEIFAYPFPEDEPE